LVSQGKSGEALDLGIRAFGRAKTAEAGLAISRAFPQLLAKLEGHSDAVYQAEFSPDGQRIVTASWDKTARVWNAANGQVVAKLEGHSDLVSNYATRTERQRAKTASAEYTARVWNAANGQLVAKLEGNPEQARKCA